MPRDVNGIYTLPVGYLAVPGQTILDTNHNPALEDLAQAISESFALDGRAAMTGHTKMGGKKVTGMADGVLPTDAAALGQLTAAITAAELGRLHKITYVTATGTHTLDATTTAFIAQVQGAGGGGGGAQAVTTGQTRAYAGGGGGAGGYADRLIPIATGIVDIAVIIGAAGAGGVGALPGATGGNSSIVYDAVTITAAGGSGGGASVGGPAGFSKGGAGGAGTNSAGALARGEQGGHGITSYGEDPAALPYAMAATGQGGSSRFGGGGTADGIRGSASGLNSTGAAGAAAQGYGAGGGGAYTAFGFTPPTPSARTGGAGTPGVVVIWEFK